MLGSARPGQACLHHAAADAGVKHRLRGGSWAVHDGAVGYPECAAVPWAGEAAIVGLAAG